MSEPENFLTRWSRRKQEAEQKLEQPQDPPAGERVPESGAEAPASQGRPDEAPQPEFDLSSLPPIESIDIGTDIRAFLQKGVPLDLTRAALRRAWTADPAIRDFIGIAENQWDFATGSDLPGFGPLEASDDIRRMVAEVIQGGLKAADAERLAAINSSAEKESQPPQNTDVSASTTEPLTFQQVSEPERQSAQEILQPEALPESSDAIVHRKNIAAQQEPEPTDGAVPVKRGHGRALPQ